MAQEASKIPNGKKKVVSAGSIDAASTAQFVRHLEEDPLIQVQQDAGGLPVMDAHSDKLTNGLRASTTPSALTNLQLPIMTQEVRSRIMGILWANWEVRTSLLLPSLYVTYRMQWPGVHVLTFYQKDGSERFQGFHRHITAQANRSMTVWHALQEPVNQTVKQIHTAFDAVLDILSLQEERAASLGLPPQDAADFKAFLERTAIDLMSLSASLYVTSKLSPFLRASLLSCRAHRIPACHDKICCVS